MIISSFSSFTRTTEYTSFRNEGALRSRPDDNGSGGGKNAGELKASKEVGSTSPVSSVTPQSAEVTATNILRFVNQSVETLRAEGASEERIAERLNAAREGIEKGYADARAILEDLGKLNDGLATEIDRGETLINEGLAEIEAGQTPSLLAPAEEGSDENADDGATEPVETDYGGTAPAAGSPFTFAASGRSQSMALEVVTRDGDKVTVNFRQREGGVSLSAGGYELTASGYSSRYDMQVEGTLDDAELQALQTLFDDVGSLSETFYGGDLGAALEEAMSLGFDGNELASMSLELRQRSFSNVARAYGESGPSLPTARLQSQQNMIADYVKSYTDALDRASMLQEPRDTLQKMMEALVPDDSRLNALRGFHGGLDRLLGA
ncbi:MAG: DUF5610 domain-containing protein [Pseudomonadota bacterium]|jgi:hypothetical protein|nr:DUF5610 domain-containing protein [Pseudomonadota bacterium]MEC8104902.1 DUF5610 domain-containing protein [Pseudomonadota bacterium]MEC8523481.1 DUF5610 domain-containing protein [Pseudomonadota bacterium]